MKKALLSGILILVACAPQDRADRELARWEARAADVTIIRDDWGIPHIYADDDRALAHAFGWAQAEAHGDLLLRLYGESRARAGYEPGEHSPITREVLERALYHYEGRDAVRHLCKVACGIDSMVLGETQILTQITKAYDASYEAGLCGPVMTASASCSTRGNRCYGNHYARHQCYETPITQIT